MLGTDKFVGFLRKIPDIGLPEKFQLKNLKSLGYTSSNDERFLPVLRFIGFIDSSGTPQPLWREARGDLGHALARGIRSGYSDLFDQYTNAHQKDDEALRTFFSVHSGNGKEAVSRMVATFKAICGAANFESVGHGAATKGNEAVQTAKQNVKSKDESALEASTRGLPVSINIQLQLPSDPTGDIYDKFFAAMAKHLPVNQ